MENYKLAEDEVVLYKGVVTQKKSQVESELILTNLNIVFITKYETLEEKQVCVNVEKYPVADIKIYKEEPQIKTKGLAVEIYLLTTEIEFIFKSLLELRKFIKQAVNLLTGKTKAERMSEKIKNSIGLINETLDVDCVELVGNLIKNTSVVKGVGSTVGKIGKNLLKKK